MLLWLRCTHYRKESSFLLQKQNNVQEFREERGAWVPTSKLVTMSGMAHQSCHTPDSQKAWIRPSVFQPFHGYLVVQPFSHGVSELQWNP